MRPEVPAGRVPVQVSAWTSQRNPDAPPAACRAVAARLRGRPMVMATPYAVWADAALATVTDALYEPRAERPGPAARVTAL